MIANQDELMEVLGAVHGDIRPISADQIVVSDWVRFKCRYGCPNFGRRLCCPPYSPTPEETRRALKDYQLGVVARFETDPPSTDPSVGMDHMHESLMDIQKTVHELERQAFVSGCYKAFAMSPLPCRMCQTCVAGERLERDEAPVLTDAVRCRHRETMRPSMEACGIDVFKTLENIGYDLKVLKSRQERPVLFGLVLLD
ncbi:MAG: DUF2284 domain-containing protein [Methanosarcinales archaeon]|nr:DUF2284 domain-containing protein [Methanosarcinales archaeon]